MASSARRTQQLTIIAQDPSVKVKRKKPDTGEEEEVILTAQVDLPAEELAPGPRGYRVQVIDYDSTTSILYPPLQYRMLENGLYNDPFIDEPDSTLLNDPLFHSQNVYAIVMRTLWRFEYALGRRVGWSFDGHQLQVAPHAFADANAFYSSKDRALLFGYFPKPVPVEKTGDAANMVFSCLSHDIVVHETTHALVDGLRKRYTDPSSPEQAGFHEGFADIIALLSIFSLQPVVAKIIDKKYRDNRKSLNEDPEAILVSDLTPEALRGSLLLGLAEQFGQELADPTVLRGRPLRESVKLTPDPKDPIPLIKKPEYNEPHKRGEILVAAVMNAFIEVWSERLKGLGNRHAPDEETRTDRRMRQTQSLERSSYTYNRLERQRVVEEGANIADYLLTMAIRALDYTPPTDLEFCDFLSAMLTADYEIRPDDSRYNFRKILLESFRRYGMEPTSRGASSERGVWEPPGCELKYHRIHLESMLRDKDEMFRFIWENRNALGLEEDAYTRVLSVRPCVRINPDDGFTLRETVAEYIQILTIDARELKHFGIKTPKGMSKHQAVTLYGGGALILDEFGHVKFHVRNRLLNPERQTRRLQYLWEYGAFDPSQQSGDSSALRFAQMHLMRFGISPVDYERNDDDQYLESDEEKGLEEEREDDSNVEGREER